MTNPKPPITDSIRELADFWDAHDLTDFEADLEEVAGPVFSRRHSAATSTATTAPDTEIRVPLQRREADAVERLARADGVSREELLRRWVVQRIANPRRGNAAS